MFFPVVTEKLARVAHLPSLDDGLESLRCGAPEEAIGGLADPAKAPVAALPADKLLRPLVDSGGRGGVGE